MRQQMLMLLTTQPQEAPQHASGRPRAESSYHIEWRLAEEDADSPATARPTTRCGFSFEPDTKELRDELLAKASAGELPPGYFERQWDGVWREPTDLPQGVLHPAFRESKFTKTGGASREERRREIERRVSKRG